MYPGWPLIAKRRVASAECRAAGKQKASRTRSLIRLISQATPGTGAPDPSWLIAHTMQPAPPALFHPVLIIVDRLARTAQSSETVWRVHVRNTSADPRQPTTVWHERFYDQSWRWRHLCQVNWNVFFFFREWELLTRRYNSESHTQTEVMVGGVTPNKRSI